MKKTSEKKIWYKTTLFRVVIGLIVVLFVVYNSYPYYPRMEAEGTYIDTKSGVCIEFDNGFRWTFYEIGAGALCDEEEFETGDRVRIIHKIFVLNGIDKIE